MDEFDQIKSYINYVSPMTDEDLKPFYEERKVKHIKKGEVLISEGDTNPKLYFIHEGVFRYYILLADGREITKDFAIDTQNPICTAFTSFLHDQPSVLCIDALTDAKVSVWSKSYFLNLMKENVSWLAFTQRFLTGMIIRKERKEISFIKDDALQRFEHFKIEHGCLLDRIPNYYIASYLTIAPESLSRIKKQS